MSTATLSTRFPARVGIVAATTAALIGIASPLFSPAQASAPDLQAISASLSANSPLDELGRPNPETQERIRAFAAQPWIPLDARNAILSALAFSLGEGGAGQGPALVDGPGPEFRQFYWPTVSAKCIGGQSDAMGSAIAVPGPTQIPAPGAGEGESVFLFTALGTSPAAADQGGMHVRWFNIDTLQAGITPLFNNGINADGPTTVSGRAATGKGTVVGLLEGSVNTQDASCAFAPTAAFFEVK
ncbi:MULTISPECIES: hypothetical protein [Corynebacterium]|uniref:Rv1157c family protein n=1 Tax=Corynebacterium TaxID=1716 RepID=UPI00257CD27F|nr:MULTISPECIES: hypothetical protein [Corynebacterium]